MIKHMVLFRFRPEVPAQTRDTLLREYVGFPQIHPTMRNFTLGRNISQRDQSYEYAFTVEFDSEADLKDYLNSREHEAHVIERFRPLIEARAIVSYEVAAGAVTDLFG
jgi:heme-degrading monooxygenase HmoA